MNINLKICAWSWKEKTCPSQYNLICDKWKEKCGSGSDSGASKSAFATKFKGKINQKQQRQLSGLRKLVKDLKFFTVVNMNI